jgi:MoaA/NifB/PqqE/SkfB family radical SAM enzyme
LENKERIKIVNWILTRRCNLNCKYCAIIAGGGGQGDYPISSYYHKNEMSLDYIKMALLQFKMHNPDCFHIFYGGEPLLRNDLPDIINFCNENRMHYTIISNNSRGIQDRITNLLRSVDEIKGFTASIDPVLATDNSDRAKKSREGLANLVVLKEHTKIKDLVAEVTVMKHDISDLHRFIRKLSDLGICSDLTFVDIAKNSWYDFSNVYGTEQLVRPSLRLAGELVKILDDRKCNVHMKHYLLEKIFDILPAKLDCFLEQGIHNITIDADGSIRLCLRIRGVHTPKYNSLMNLFVQRREVSYQVREALIRDKRNYCQLCNHTCQLMSMTDDVAGLVHLDVREGKKDG